MKTCKGLLIAILLCCVYGVGCKYGRQTPLIPDSNLAAIVRLMLNLSADTPLTAGMLSNLKTLDASWILGGEIADLTGLEYATNLTELYLGNNEISDVSALSSLTHLTHLSLDNNALSDVSALSSLTNLRVLWLQDSQLSDISALTNLRNLTELYLDNNKVSDIAPLVANIGLNSGDTVNLSGNPLNEASIKTHIPALQARGVAVAVKVKYPRYD